MTSKLAVVLSREREGQPGHETLEREILAGLQGRHDLKVTIVPHLYDLSGDGSGMEFLRSVDGDMILLAWLYPRSAYWVLHANGIRGRLGPTSSLPEEEADAEGINERTLWCLDLRGESRPEPFWEEINRIVAAIRQPVADLSGETNGRLHFVDEAVAPRWYPVVDFSRCGHCLECLNFCLFGVFGLDDEEHLVVEQPDACRPGCPACSRICPEGAIMFPQHQDPAIAGDPQASLGVLKLDLSQLFRNADPHQIAETERKRALAERDRQQHPQGGPSSGESKGELDDLVDGIDEMEL